MGDWAEAWWLWFTHQPPPRQTMILAGFGILLICAMLGVPWAAGRRDRYIGRRRRGWLIEPEPEPRFVTHFPRFEPPGEKVTKRRIRTAFAIPWDGISGAHRTVSDPQEPTRRLHPGDVNTARASVEQTQTRMRLNAGWKVRIDAHSPDLAEERAARYGRQYLESIRSGSDGDYSGQTRRLRRATQERTHEEERREDRERGKDANRPLENGEEGSAHAEEGEKVADANVYWRSDPRTGEIVMVDARGIPIDWDSGE